MPWASTPGAFLRWLRYQLRRSLSLRQRLFIAVGCIAGALLVRFFLEPMLDGGIPFVTFLPAVLIASLWGGILSGLSSTSLASLLGYYMLSTPRVSDGFGSQAWVRMVAFWVFCGLFIIIHAASRTAQFRGADPCSCA